jgi:hypothetical protein
MLFWFFFAFVFSAIFSLNYSSYCFQPKLFVPKRFAPNLTVFIYFNKPWIFCACAEQWILRKIKNYGLHIYTHIMSIKASQAIWYTNVMLSITMMFVMSKIAHTVIVVSGVFSAHPLMFCARQSNNRLEFNQSRPPFQLGRARSQLRLQTPQGNAHQFNIRYSETVTRTRPQGPAHHTASNRNYLYHNVLPLTLLYSYISTSPEFSVHVLNNKY